MNKILILIFSLVLIEVYISESVIYVNGLEDEEILFEKKAEEVETSTDSEDLFTDISSESNTNTQPPDITSSSEEEGTIDDGTSKDDEENTTKESVETGTEEESDYEGLYSRIQHITNINEFIQCIKSDKVENLICILDNDIYFSISEMTNWKPLYFNGTIIGNKYKIRIESFDAILQSNTPSFGLFSKIISNSLIEDLHIVVENPIKLTSSYEINYFGILSGIIEKGVVVERINIEINSIEISDMKNTITSNIGLLSGLCKEYSSISNINVNIRNTLTIINSEKIIYGNVIGNCQNCNVSYGIVIIPKYSLNTANNNNNNIIIGGIIGISEKASLVASYIIINYYYVINNNNNNNNGVYYIGFLIGEGSKSMIAHSFVVIPQFYIYSNNNNNNKLYVGGFLSKSSESNITSCYSTIIYKGNDNEIKNVYYSGVVYSNNNNNKIKDCYLNGKLGLYDKNYIISDSKDNININGIIIDFSNLNNDWKLFGSNNKRLLIENDIKKIYIINDNKDIIISDCNNGECKIMSSIESNNISNFENMNFVDGFWRSFPQIGLSQLPLVDINSINTESFDINIMNKIRFYPPNIYNQYFNNESYVFPLQGLPYLSSLDKIYLTSTTYPSTYVVDVNYKNLNKNNCLNECNHHGDCNNNVCICDSGYMGLDCSFLNCVSNNNKIIENKIDGMRQKTKILNECSGNGICNNGKCECNSKYEGIGCSKEVN